MDVSDWILNLFSSYDEGLRNNSASNFHEFTGLQFGNQLTIR